LPPRPCSTSHPDVLRDAVQTVVAELMEAEISAEIGATHGEISDTRLTHRKGHRPRLWETRVDELELLIPRKRSGEAYFPSFLEPRRRSEQAIVAVVMEADVNSVSTRTVDRIVEQLGIGGMTRDRVSALCRVLDAKVTTSRTRPLEGDYLVPVARRQDRQDPRPRPRLPQGARHRVRGPRVRPARGHRASTSARRSRSRSGSSSCAPSASAAWGRRPAVHQRPAHGPEERDRADPRRTLAALRRPLRARHAPPPPAVPAGHGVGRPARDLQRREPEEDLLAFYRFSETHWSKLRSTNPLERVNREIARPADVVGIFRTDAAALRLSGALPIEQNDEWLVGRRYLSEESLDLVLGESDAEEREEVKQLARRLTSPTRRYTTPSDLTLAPLQEIEIAAFVRLEDVVEEQPEVPARSRWPRPR
jgi:hypothetical protein